jgi:nitrogen regulatory protein P-II 1
MTKKIEAIIREEKLTDVKESLHRIGIVGMNVSEVQGHGRQGGIVLTGRAGTYQVDMLPRIQVNIVLSDHNVEKTVRTIREAARTGSDAGDGLIFVYPVDDVVRIRTGERGHDALSYQDDIDSRLARYYAPPGRGEPSNNEDKPNRVPGAPGKEKGEGFFSRLRKH